MSTMMFCTLDLSGVHQRDRSMGDNNLSPHTPPSWNLKKIEPVKANKIKQYLYCLNTCFIFLLIISKYKLCSFLKSE